MKGLQIISRKFFFFARIFKIYRLLNFNLKEFIQKELSITIKAKDQLYDVLSKRYYLPDRNSKASNKEYLIKYTLSPIPIFVMEKDKVTHHNYRYRKYNSYELLELLENSLKKKKKLPTGLTLHTIPNVEWLKNAILSLEPEDPFELLAPKKEEKATYQIQVNEE